MKIYTRKGDGGTTSLLGGGRVPKHHLRIEAYGTVDELSSVIGLLATEAAAAEERGFLQQIQHHLFTIGASLAVEGEDSKAFRPDLEAQDIKVLEVSIDTFTAFLPELKHFVLPGSDRANALAHLCRTVCRRAERLVVGLQAQSGVDPLVVQYLNRLSDWFFVYGRVLTHRQGTEEVKWVPRAKQP
ncbi:MAG: cob(I)yrinic acid a,c-diamide adenosyltransferase [Bacteroidia bacterium]|nr:cob(I)yrinic acid a,c-diamide adenosyltransferase [Bacteroidia bacterium]